MKLVNHKQLLLLFLTAMLVSCDPAMKGDLKVYNESDKVLTIKYSNDKDTAVAELQPGSDMVVGKIGGMGDNRDFKCCPNRSWVYSIKSPAGPIKKDHRNCDSWNIPNKEKLRRYSNPPIKCELHITQADL
jgi:hypothetical protein